MDGILEHIRVLDLSHFIAGPFCAMLFGDMGAEVIKVEKTGKGEDSRELVPMYNGFSLYFAHQNKNKKSITLNFRSEKGKELLYALVKQADVLIENFRPGTLEKMGLTKEKFDQLNPNIIVTSISGFGQNGPYKERPAFDAIAQAMSGVMSMTGTGESGPLVCGTFIGDYLTGVFAAFGTLTALYHRDVNKGKGQLVDIALVDALYATTCGSLAYFHKTGKIIQASGNADKVLYPADRFKTKDGYIYIHAGSDPLFKKLCEAMNRTELLDGNYKDAGWRFDHKKEVEHVVQEWVCKKTIEEVEAVLVKAGVPVGPVNDMRRILQDPQMNARKTFEFVNYPKVGEISVPGVAVKMSETPGQIYRRPPMLGEHNEEIYTQWLQLTHEEISKLKENGDI